MPSFKKAVSAMDAVLFDSFGEPAIYNGSTKARVVIDLDVEQLGAFDTQGPVRRHEVSFLVSEISNPKRGQAIVAESGEYILDGSIVNDGRVARWHINES